ncbi:MAG: transposase [Bacteroidia bacterium]
MSRKYKFHNKSGIYFVSFATVYWIDIFVRQIYSSVITDSLNFCIKNKGMVVNCWCLMPSHIHLIFSAQHNNPGDLLRDFKSHTSKKLQKEIIDNPQESRKEWMLWMMERAGKKNSNIEGRQLWQQHNQPIELWSNEVFDQKMDYTHFNPVVAGFVDKPEHWKLSSACDYTGEKGLVDIVMIK